MWARFYCLLIWFVLILNLVGVSSRVIQPNHDFALNTQAPVHVHHSMQTTHSSNEIKGNVGLKEGKYHEIKKIGSKPPRCEHKCYGCMPCEAIQVPTVSSHEGVLYTNYEPEGWKCKCGPTFYSP